MISRVILLLVSLGLLLTASAPCAAQESDANAVPLKVAAVCMNAQTDTAANLETFESYIAEAAEQGAHLVVFPEFALQQNPALNSPSASIAEDELSYLNRTAESIPGPSTDKLVRMARTHRIWVAFGMTERGLDSQLFNTSVVLGPTGVLGSCRKFHLLDAQSGGNEHVYYSRADQRGNVVESPLGRIGLMVGWDIMAQYTAAVTGVLGEGGADFIVTASAWPTPWSGAYDPSTTKSAQAIGRWHIVANQTGSVGHAIGYGHSRIIDPDGVIIADTGQEEGMVIAETDVLVSSMLLPPIVDFNGDGEVDGEDVLALAAHWGQDDAICDIAPAPSGDGIVDVQDLILLAGYIGEDVTDLTLIAHWALDEAAGMFSVDSISGRNGLALGAPVWRPDGGYVGGALEFDGMDDCLIVDFPSDQIVGPFSAVAWVQGGALGQVIVSQEGVGYWLRADLLPPQTAVADGIWHRVGFVWDGVNGSLHVDGVEVAADVQPELTGPNVRLRIGCGTDMSPGTFFSGLIDDVRIYNRAVRL